MPRRGAIFRSAPVCSMGVGFIVAYLRRWHQSSTSALRIISLAIEEDDARLRIAQEVEEERQKQRESSF